MVLNYVLMYFRYMKTNHRSLRTIPLPLPDWYVNASCCTGAIVLCTLTLGPLLISIVTGLDILKSMRSEGVGKMLLYTPSGISFDGFDSVVFSKQSAEKLASIADVCDTDKICVYMRKKRIVYASVIWSAEKDITNINIASLSISDSSLEETKQSKSETRKFT